MRHHEPEEGRRRHDDMHDHHHRGPHRHGDGAQTFRRGRALDFLKRLEVKRATLAKQLEQTELQAIYSVISGELKAVELIRNEFIELFELHEFHESNTDNQDTTQKNNQEESSSLSDEPSDK
jgi:hypothetical protein